MRDDEQWAVVQYSVVIYTLWWCILDVDVHSIIMKYDRVWRSILWWWTYQHMRLSYDEDLMMMMMYKVCMIMYEWMYSGIWECTQAWYIVIHSEGYSNEKMLLWTIHSGVYTAKWWRRKWWYTYSSEVSNDKLHIH